MSLDSSTRSPSPLLAVPAQKPPLSSSESQCSNAEGMQDAIISHSPGSYSIHKPTHLQVEEVPSPAKSPFGWTTRYRGATGSCSAGKW